MRFPVSRSLGLAGVLLLISVLTGCSGLTVNSTSEGADQRLMLKGHDPVAYFTDGKHVPGDPNIKVQHEGVVYRFASEDHKEMFLKDPTHYEPKYGGFCANGIVYGIPWGGDPDSWAIIEDRLYIFGGHGSKKYFMMDEKKNVELAEQYWNSEVRGKNPIVQRYKRLTFRVPHYKTGKELEAEWQSRQGKTSG